MMQRLYLFVIAWFVVCTCLTAQYAINGQAPFGTGTAGAAGDIAFTSSINGTQRLTVTTTNAAQRNFRLVTRNATNVRSEVGPTGCSANLTIGTQDGVSLNGVFPCTAASFRTNGNTAVYVLKTPAANQSATFILWRLSAAVREITAVSSTVAAGSVAAAEPVTVTATLGSGQVTPNGQTMYIRYSDDGFANSSVVSMTDNGNGTFSGNIPGQQEGETVSYYLLTSATSTTNPAVTAANADLRTITFNNNGGSNYSYTVTAAPLPVTYTAWRAHRGAVGVELYWSTGSETNAADFAVERSSDGGQDWRTVGTVVARNRPEGADYHFTDTGTPAATFYRLRQSDIDGTYEYSPILFVGDTSAPDALSVFPQPGPADGITLLGSTLAGTKAELLDATGRRVITFILSGSAQPLPTAGLPAGSYVLRISAAGAVPRRVVIY